MPKYIDADEYIKYCEENWIVLNVDAVNKQPEADVEPKRKTGRWKIAGAFDDFCQCPECGNMWPIFSTIEWAFCPVCGCRMMGVCNE